jgi:hypothetical protein
MHRAFAQLLTHALRPAECYNAYRDSEECLNFNITPVYKLTSKQAVGCKYKELSIVTYSGFSIHDGTLLHSKSQYTTVKHSQQLFEHTYTSDLYGTGTLIPIEFFQQDVLWQSSNTHSHSCSHKASKHPRSICRRAIGPLAHHNGTSAYSPSLTCTSPDDRMSSSSMV